MYFREFFVYFIFVYNVCNVFWYVEVFSLAPVTSGDSDNSEQYNILYCSGTQISPLFGCEGGVMDSGSGKKSNSRVRSLFTFVIFAYWKMLLENIRIHLFPPDTG